MLSALRPRVSLVQAPPQPCREQSDSFDRFSGEVEADETFIGGKARNMHKRVRKQKIHGAGGTDKAKVFGMIERGGHVRAEVVPDLSASGCKARVRDCVELGASIFTDRYRAYTGLDTNYDHRVVDHAVQYVDGQDHTNYIEDFRALLIARVAWRHISVELFPPVPYLDKHVFTFNLRERDDSGASRASCAPAAAVALPTPR